MGACSDFLVRNFVVGTSLLELRCWNFVVETSFLEILIVARHLKSARYADYLILGERSGRRIGTKSSIAVSAAEGRRLELLQAANSTY